MEKKIDPELIRQLEPSKNASAKSDSDDEFVEAVIKLETKAGTKSREFVELLEALLVRLEETEHRRPEDYNVFPMMQRAVIRADKAYLSKLIDQAEVIAATVNRKKD